jgi:hypothetical protein
MSPTITNDTMTFVEISKRLLSDGYHVRFQAHGTSMLPALGDGAPITIEFVEPSAVNPGDILLYQNSGRPVAHRVVEIHRKGEAVVAFLLRGDAKAACDAPVEPAQILGRVLLPAANVTVLDATMLWLRVQRARNKIMAAALNWKRRVSLACNSREAAHVRAAASSSPATLQARPDPISAHRSSASAHSHTLQNVRL